ncbi:shikimate kinase [Anaerolentibacter hominis]|uniref:shikimate kinase n=1 Tax=Anaerolentibacter hominis TaxID=3079009 RepID=UPI0031B800E7
MPAAGKSTIGVILAKAMGFRFVDSDLLIQETEGRLLSEIIVEEGIDSFIAIENRINAGILAERSIISPGGSVVYGEEAMEHLREIGTVVYLRLSYTVLKKRIGNPKKRGVVLKDGQSLKDLYKERCPLYEKYAHIIVDADGLSVGQLMQKTREAIETFRNGKEKLGGT